MYKLLIIDDDTEALAIAEARLAQEQVEIYCASGGIEGLNSARWLKPDLILLDIDMPDLSGFEVCKTLKADSELCLIPVLFLSGSGGAENKVFGLDLGATDFITKPFDSFELRARVRAALRTKRLQDLLIERAHIDPLTGLPNRRALMERLEVEWARRQRRRGELSFIMIDIDHFKRVNDAFGHTVGDQYLQEVARRIQQECRQVDLPARYGGEEFAVVVPDESAEKARCLAERCRTQVEQIVIPARNEHIQTTASFGVADAAALPTFSALIDAADQALLHAKSQGRNRVEVSREKMKI
ncbi:MAG: diguanylate cyclase [Pirellulales bacterium]|nr:diguanylate cyclase [Pirellulales bacterium]